jgi:hypothetical protein
MTTLPTPTAAPLTRDEIWQRIQRTHFFVRGGIYAGHRVRAVHPSPTPGKFVCEVDVVTRVSHGMTETIRRLVEIEVTELVDDNG